MHTCPLARRQAGKVMAKLNSLKHGERARTVVPVLPQEDPRSWTRRSAVGRGLAPYGDPERDLVARAAKLSWLLDRAERSETAGLAVRVQAAKLPSNVETVEKVCDLGRKLLYNAGPRILPVSGPPWDDNPAAFLCGEEQATHLTLGSSGGEPHHRQSGRRKGELPSAFRELHLAMGYPDPRVAARPTWVRPRSFDRLVMQERSCGWTGLCRFEETTDLQKDCRSGKLWRMFFDGGMSTLILGNSQSVSKRSQGNPRKGELPKIEAPELSVLPKMPMRARSWRLRYPIQCANEAIYERAVVKRGGADFASRAPAHPLRRRLRSIWPISDLSADEVVVPPATHPLSPRPRESSSLIAGSVRSVSRT